MAAPARLDDAPPTDTTIVIPTYNERANVPELLSRLAQALPGQEVEVLFVDDSVDDTPAVIAASAARSRLPVRCIHRAGAERTGGLAGAVATGIHEARGDYVIVMDGDLQHPPEMAPALRRAASDADLALASRYALGGRAAGLDGIGRRIVSRASTVLAQACFPRRVGRTCTDPMTGFFCFRRSAVDASLLRPRGFKILLEILARHDLSVVEVPFTFAERVSGDSKASWRNGLHFVYQMASLRLGRMSRFAVVGVLGTLVNLVVMALLLAPGVGAPLVVAAMVAAEVSILHNFLLQERFVFRDLRGGARGWWRRLAAHTAFNTVEALVRLPLLIPLVVLVGLPSVAAQAVTLAIAFVVRFLFVSRVVYRPRSGPRVTIVLPDDAPVVAEARRTRA